MNIQRERERGTNRCGGRLDSGFGGDDGGGGSVNSIDAVVVEACHGGI
jgi:hypothetical protein